MGKYSCNFEMGLMEMTKFTVEKLIEFLSLFPPELEIEQELKFKWWYPDDLTHSNLRHTDYEAFRRITQVRATRLEVGLGNWEEKE